MQATLSDVLRPLVVLWLAAPSLLPEHRDEIGEWTRARGRRPVSPEARLESARYDAALADRVEQLLEAARSATPGDEEPFEDLERLLENHPELPQAAWWMAERDLTLLQRRSESVDPRAASDAPLKGGLVLRARRLEGQRATAFGLEAVELPPVARSALSVTGARPGDQILVDGVDVSELGLLEVGRHHVQTFRSGRRLWAAWVDIGTPAELGVVEPAAPCSELDLIGTTAEQRAAAAPPGVLCPEWVVARPSPQGGTEFSACRGDRCAPWEQLRRAPSGVAATLRVPEEDAGLPSWVSWTALGVGAATAAALILWRTGAFESSPATTEFVFTGPSAAALTF